MELQNASMPLRALRTETTNFLKDGCVGNKCYCGPWNHEDTAAGIDVSRRYHFMDRTVWLWWGSQFDDHSSASTSHASDDPHDYDCVSPSARSPRSALFGCAESQRRNISIFLEHATPWHCRNGARNRRNVERHAHAGAHFYPGHHGNRRKREYLLEVPGA